MIEKIIFDSEAVATNCLWYGSDMDAGGLAGAVDYAIQNNVSVLSVLPDAVPIIWPWVEKNAIKIFSRFYIDGSSDLAVVSEKIVKTFKNGANGAQIFLGLSQLKSFSDSIKSVRDDLFFDKEFIIGLDVLDINFSDWKTVFDYIKSLRCDGINLLLSNDMGDKSDFVGHIMSMFELWPDDLKCSIYLNFGDNPMRVEQTMRLGHMVHPEIIIKSFKIC